MRSFFMNHIIYARDEMEYGKRVHPWELEFVKEMGSFFWEGIRNVHSKYMTLSRYRARITTETASFASNRLVLVNRVIFH